MPDFKLEGDAHIKLGPVEVHLSSRPPAETLEELLTLRDRLLAQLQEVQEKIKQLRGEA